jgi:hypothetical protein
MSGFEDIEPQQGVTTIEYESGVVNDLKEAFKRLIPRNMGE